MSAYGIHFEAIFANGIPRFSIPVSQAMSIPFCTTLGLQLSVYRPLCYNSRGHCPLRQCLHTTSVILAGALSHFVVSSFKYEGEKLIPWVNPQPSYYVRKEKDFKLHFNTTQGMSTSGLKQQYKKLNGNWPDIRSGYIQIGGLMQ